MKGAPAVVTGASSGIGNALVEAHFSDGYSVVACHSTFCKKLPPKAA